MVKARTTRRARAEAAPQLATLLQSAVVDAGAAPSAAAAALFRDAATGEWLALVGGAACNATGPQASLFDLASLTKPVVALTAARLARAGRVSLTTPLAEYLDCARGSAVGGRSLEQLLAHRAGLEGHRELFAPLLRGLGCERGALLQAAAEAVRPDAGDAPGAVYSDLGYLLLGAALESATGESLDALVRREVSEPLGAELGSAAEWRVRAPDFDARVLPTEHVPWRGGLVRGAVHDENAWAFAGCGLAGHAGLFGTLLGVAALAAGVLDALAGREPDWLGTRDVEPLVRVRDASSLRAGFDGRSPGASTAGTRLGAASFGHLGFTGTSVWCDPEQDVALVLLTNRVSPTRANTLLPALRGRLNDRLFELMTAHPRWSAAAQAGRP